MLDGIVERGRVAVAWDWRLTVLGPFLLTFVVTRLLTSIQSYQAQRVVGKEKKPPIVQYAVPVVGNLLDFAFNTKEFLGNLRSDSRATIWISINQKCRGKYGPNIPVRFRVMNRKAFYISGAENLLAIFRGSRDLTTTPSSILVLENAFGHPKSISHIMLEDNTGVLPQPLEGSAPIKPNNRIFSIMHKGLHTHLNGKGLAVLGDKFTSFLESGMEALRIGTDEWTEVPDLYRLIQEVVFQASAKSLCGPHLFELNPSFTSDFWEFDSHVPSLFKLLPKWMVPAAYRARDRLNKSLMKWHAFAEEHFDAELEKRDPQMWEEYFGHRLMRERRTDMKQIDDYTDEARAANDLGMIWG